MSISTALGTAISNVIRLAPALGFGEGAVGAADAKR